MTPGSSREHPIIRPTARVLLLDESDRMLLFTAMTPDEETGLPFWFPPGGGVEEGESHEDAAARELLEETGLTVPLGPQLWDRMWYGQLQQRRYEVHEKFYLARCDNPVITVNSWTELELQALKEYRWWTLGEIQAAAQGHTDVFVPRELPRLLPDVLAGKPFEAPFGVE